MAPPRRSSPSTHRAGLRRPAAAFPPIPPFPLPEAGRCGERPASFGAEPLSDCTLCAQERRGTCGLAEVLPPLGNRSRGFSVVSRQLNQKIGGCQVQRPCPRAACRSPERHAGRLRLAGLIMYFSGWSVQGSKAVTVLLLLCRR